MEVHSVSSAHGTVYGQSGTVLSCFPEYSTVSCQSLFQLYPSGIWYAWPTSK